MTERLPTPARRGITTRALHCPPARKDPHGALRVPLYDAVAFEFDSADDIRLAFEGKKPAHAYSRLSNPTVEDLENRVRLMTDASAVVAFASGMAAVSNVLLTLGWSGANVVTSRRIFGNTLALFSSTMKAWGLQTRLVDATDPAAVAAAVDGDTCAVFLEAVSNPQLEVTDLAAVARALRGLGAPFVLDSTVVSPHPLHAAGTGVDLEVLSSTKAVSGGATSVGGLVLVHNGFDWGRSPKLGPRSRRFGPHTFTQALRQEVQRNFGACLSPHNAWLQVLGLETLALRVERSSANALAMARFLAGRPEVRAVSYPGLEASPFHAVAARQFGSCCGPLLTCRLAGRSECFAFLDRLRLVRRATNLADNKTLAIHPASTIFAEFPAEERAAMGVPDDLIRISAGIEDPADLLDDLASALEGR